jgi:hypothetical protein
VRTCGEVVIQMLTKRHQVQAEAKELRHLVRTD